MPGKFWKEMSKSERMQLKALVCLLGVFLLLLLAVVSLLHGGDHEEETPQQDSVEQEHIPMVEHLHNVWVMEADARGLLCYVAGEERLLQVAAAEVLGQRGIAGQLGSAGQGGTAGQPGIVWQPGTIGQPGSTRQSGTMSQPGNAGQSGNGLEQGYAQEEDWGTEAWCLRVREQVADLELTDGLVTDVELKSQKVSGKVLGVDQEAVWLEGQGRLEFTREVQGYRLYRELMTVTYQDLRIGYDFADFCLEEGKICAILLAREEAMETIRVLLKNSDYQGIYHDRVELTCDTDYTVQVLSAANSQETVTLHTAGERMELTVPEGARLVVKPTVRTGKMILTSIRRSQGIPAYRGSLELLWTEGGTVLINELPLEEYLYSVVPSEMPASYPQEALKAQAICARTYAWRQIMANSYKNYGAHVDDSTRYQVYNNTETYESTDAAVNDTYGKMVMYHGQVAEIYYFSTSCGHTTDGTIWGADPSSYPYLKGVAVKEGGGTLDLTDDKAFSEYIKSSPSGFESQFAMYRWNTKLTSSQLEAKVPGIGNITGLTMKERSVGGIGKVLVVEGSSGSKEIRGEGQIRGTLGCRELVIERQDKTTVTGWDSLPSAFVAIEAGQPDSNGVITFTIYGGGYGHGVGMSQNGAQGMAKAGKTYRQILEFFYPGAEAAEIDEIS